MTKTRDLERLLYTAGLDITANRFLLIMAMNGIGFVIAATLIFVNLSIFYSITAGAITFFVYSLAIYAALVLSASSRAAKMEESLPDFLTLMASNLKSGLTPDRAFVVSAKKEFGPLTKEIDKAAKLAVAGKPFEVAFESIGENVASIPFIKAVRLIVEGIRAGGNLAELLENTASDVRRFNTIKSEVSSNVMIYELFLFAAAGFGAPLLYSTANFLITIVFKVKSLIHVDTAAIEATGVSGLGLLNNTSSLSPDVAFTSSIILMVITTLFSSLAAGIITKGRSDEGFKYFPILLLIAISVFFGTRALLEMVFSVLLHV